MKETSSGNSQVTAREAAGDRLNESRPARTTRQCAGPPGISHTCTRLTRQQIAQQTVAGLTVERRTDPVPRASHPCPILGAKWERRPAARRGQMLSDAVNAGPGNAPDLRRRQLSARSTANAPSCGPGCRGFESPRSTHRSSRLKGPAKMKAGRLGSSVSDFGSKAGADLDRSRSCSIAAGVIDHLSPVGQVVPRGA